MSKSVLVIDTPEKCDSCMCIGTFHSFCKINCRDIKDTSVKPDWCPMKPLPEKSTTENDMTDYQCGMVDGRNQCINEITSGVKKMEDSKPILEIDRGKNEVTIKCNGDTIKFKDDNVEVTRASKNMMFKPPEITPQLAISAYAVLHQYCNSISPHDCNRCAFYEHCPECFMGCPGEQGEVIRKLQSNE